MTGSLKTDTRNLINFHVSSRKYKNLHFDGLVLLKTYKVLDKKSIEELCLMTLKSDRKLIFEKYALFV